MKKAFILCLMVFFGCTDSDENASTNLRKGDEFLARGEYEVAEYYYDKIPEESVLYKTVLRRRQEMEKQQASGGAVKRVDRNAEGVFVTKHSYSLQMGRIPIHTISILNNTSKRVNTIEMEFVYLDDTGKEVARLLTMVNAMVDPAEEKEIGKITPGMVTEKFKRVKIDIKRTLLF
ncbi:MAG: FxLYD domain-containing protein [Bacteriovoracaceae bacterium]|nr:FxLYD domain-containing protein [Bacteroidota bacterium]